MPGVREKISKIRGEEWAEPQRYDYTWHIGGLWVRMAWFWQRVSLNGMALRLGQTVAYWMSGWGAWMLYTVRISCKRWDVKSVSLGEWHMEYRVYLSSVRQKIRCPKWATWQRQSENKEKFNKTTQHNATQLSECRVSGVHFHKVARAKEGH